MYTPDKHYIVLKALVGNKPAQLNQLQAALEPHAHMLSLVWWSVWVLTAVVLCALLFRAYRNR